MATNIRCIAKRMNGGQSHEHIAQLWWVKCVDGRDTSEQGNYTREQMVQYIETNGNTSVWCADRNPQLPGAWVRVHSNGRIKYVQTVADGRVTDNLLSLPDR
jgi:hypothetical protein